MKKIAAILLLMFSFLSFATPVPVLAQDTIKPVCDQVQGTQKSSVCNADNNNVKLIGPDGIIVKVTRLLATVAGVGAVIMIMVGGYQYITSTGDSGRVQKAKNVILYSLIGLLIAAFAPYIVGYAIRLLT